MVDISRETTGVLLPRTVSSEVWKTASEESAVMRLARRIDIPAGGATVPMISGTPLEADWVAETAVKPVKTPTLGNKEIRSSTLALIVPFSNQFRRDLNTLYNAIAEELPGAIARAFDRTVFGYKAPPSAYFDTLDGAPETVVAGTDTYADLIAAASSVAAAGGDLSAWVVSPSGELTVLGSVDTTGRPLFTASPNTDGMGSIGSLLGRPVYRSKHIEGDLGFAGDWDTAVYGVVEDINISISEHATITGVGNLWERNMFALRVEAEYAFGVQDDQKFTKLVSVATP